jgi:hypothetical protein
LKNPELRKTSNLCRIINTDWPIAYEAKSEHVLDVFSALYDLIVTMSLALFQAPQDKRFEFHYGLFFSLSICLIFFKDIQKLQIFCYGKPNLGLSILNSFNTSFLLGKAKNLYTNFYQYIKNEPVTVPWIPTK